MADFLDSEAEESEDEMLDKNDKKRLKKIQDSESEEEDDEEKLREELKDLIDDNPIEEESDGDDSDASQNSKKRKKSDDEDFDDRLDDEDYDVIEENLGVKVERKRFKRLKRIDDEESEDEGQDQEAEQDRDAIANELFDGGSGDEDERSERSHRPVAETYDDVGSEEESDADDFIVDDDGEPIRKPGPRKKHIFNDVALQEAQDIFGIDFDYDEFEKYGDDYEEDEEEEEEDEYAEDDDAERLKKTKKAAKKKATKKSIFEIYEPSELKRGHFTDLDNEIRTTDIPERMQLRSVPVTLASEEELTTEAQWIYNQAFERKTVSIQDAHLNAEAKERARKGPQAVSKIKKALDFMRNQHFEVPFISFYRKEYVLPELNINDLWKIYKYDAKWCQLRQRKEALLVLFRKMKRYQEDHIMKDIDAPLPENMRLIEDEDIKQLENVQTTEELNDSYHHFMLYYSHEIPKMQEIVRKQEKEKRHLERIARRKQQITEAEENGEEPPPEEPEDVEEEENDETLKQAVRTGPYSICRRAGLDSLAKKFGLPPEQFAKNLSEEYQIYEVDQEPTEPNVVAAEFINEKFSTTEEVLKAAQLMVAMQIAREPLVRESVRKMYKEKAKISVRPTKKGIKIIDENHPIYTMKYVKGKPVRDLVGDQYLKLAMAQDDKLITISFSDQIEGNTTNNYVEQMKQLYYRDEFSKNVQEWNDLRVGSVEMALTKMVIPDLKKELHSILLTEAKDCVMRSCARKMYNWIKIAPYSCEYPDEEDEEWDTTKGIRVMGLAYVSDFSVAAFACMIAPDGECTDYLKLPHILKRKNSFRESDKVMKEADLLAIKNFIATKKPHTVVIGGESRDALMIAEDVKEVIASLVADEQFPNIGVEIMDNELAAIYSNSHKGISEFRDYPELLRQAISLARRLQDPLVEFSQLCNADDEILCLKFHSLQDQLPKEDLLENICLEFVNRVNEVGVDVNKAVQQPYSGNLVQFVAGLGPRKGQYLMKTLKQTNQRLENRTQLVTLCHMGPKVFINCAGFIKIDTNSLGDSTEAYVEVLDGSRVHPETYEWARKMAVDALEYEDEETNPAGALEEILESPERLKDLDLDAFAEELERQGFGNKCITLYDIRSELNCRYKDLRIPYQSATPDKLFDILTKETPETFHIGKLLEATVVGISYKKPKGEQLDQANPVRNDDTGLWQCPFCLKNEFPELSEVWNHFDAGACPGKATGIRLRLDNGISGYIHIKNLSDKHVVNPEERVRIGHRIHCRIIKIETDRFGVEATSKSSDLADKNNEWRPPKDPYYDNETEGKDNLVEEEAKKTKQRQIYVTRVIIHPSFKNITYADAEKLMQSMQQGEVIIRPSSKGDDHLTVTWKVTDDVHQHIDVREEGKENKYSLGRSLWIGNEEFEDLDEIIARHINPMAAYASELLEFKYFKPHVMGMKDKAEEILKESKRENPGGIPYVVSAAKNYPGKFMLSYLPRTRCRHEYISVTPDGFKFRGNSFSRVGDLFRWFKEHFRDPIPGQATPSTPRVYHTTPGMNMNGMNQETIQAVARQLPRAVMHSLSQVANHTPHYPQTPGAASTATGYGIHGTPYAINTPYTPSGQTPYITPYQTPANPTPRYGESTPSSHNMSGHQFTGVNEADWRRAAEAWARHTSRPGTNQGTPHTNSSPRSMSLSGDGTPLYDESL
ncbi:transcription elongation factor SPT6 isoform X2 [Phymastichus coffea]|uniref:transcription elongation factor SPT6 isoform X2 n=1 Tax=Phymastichus coffea TaxID=108790 RepID=UPI00273A8207|nr:transcription elongation factor SPT6 isoform X2 [Phymastichus coffea]